MFPFDLRKENRQRSIYGVPKPGVNRQAAAITAANRHESDSAAHTENLRPAAQVRPRKRWAWAHATATSRGGTSTRLIGVNSPEAETIAVSSRRQRVQTKRTSCGDADQFDRFTLAAIGQAPQCEHDTRNRPGSSIPIPSDSASYALRSMTNPSESFRCPSTASHLPASRDLRLPHPQASGLIGDGVAQAADPVDLDLDDVAGLHPDRRAAP